MKGVISVLLRRDKRFQVNEVEDYRGLRLFQVAGRESVQSDTSPEFAASEPYDVAQHALKKSGGVRELVLK